MSSAPERYFPEIGVRPPGIRLAAAPPAESEELQRSDQDRSVGQASDIAGERGAPSRGPWEHDGRKRSQAGNRPRDSQGVQKEHPLEARSKEHAARDSHRTPERAAWNELTESWEQPFPHIDEATRMRAKMITGRTLEESYEGLTRLLLAVVHEVVDD